MEDYNRRHFLRTSLPSFLGISLALPSITAFATRANAHQGRIPSSGTINWDAFLSKLELESARQHLDDWNEDHYVDKVAQLATQLNLKDSALAQAFADTKAGLGNERVDFYQLEKNLDFQVCLLQFEKEEEIPAHDHPQMTGVLLCATGEMDVWNYDIHQEQEQEPHKLLLKETSFGRLQKGQISTLTSKSRNIHRVKAQKLTQLVDIFTPSYNKERSEKASRFELNPEPMDLVKGTDKIYEALRK